MATKMRPQKRYADADFPDRDLRKICRPHSHLPKNVSRNALSRFPGLRSFFKDVRAFSNVSVQWRMRSVSPFTVMAVASVFHRFPFYPCSRKALNALVYLRV